MKLLQSQIKHLRNFLTCNWFQKTLKWPIFDFSLFNRFCYSWLRASYSQQNQTLYMGGRVRQKMLPWSYFHLCYWYLEAHCFIMRINGRNLRHLWKLTFNFFSISKELWKISTKWDHLCIKLFSFSE